jgi:excisionase family DNA binding protein
MSYANPNGDEILTTDEVAALLKIPKQTIYRWNVMGSGPPYYRLGKHARWKRSEVMAWVAEHQDEVSKGI